MEIAGGTVTRRRSLAGSGSAVLAIGAALFCVSILSASAESSETQADSSGDVRQWNEAIALHDRARAGEDGAADKAISLLSDITQRQPSNAVARAYLGSSQTLKARDASSIINKMRYTNRGLRSLDEAVELGADDFEVRVISANVNKSLPQMFKRTDKALEDSMVLDTIYSAAPTVCMAGHMVDIYDYLRSRALERDDAQAAAAWEQKSQTAATLAKTR